jgi:hypothetical protein
VSRRRERSFSGMSKPAHSCAFSSALKASSSWLREVCERRYGMDRVKKMRERERERERERKRKRDREKPERRRRLREHTLKAEKKTHTNIR